MRRLLSPGLQAGAGAGAAAAESEVSRYNREGRLPQDDSARPPGQECGQRALGARHQGPAGNMGEPPYFERTRMGRVLPAALGLDSRETVPGSRGPGQGIASRGWVDFELWGSSWLSRGLQFWGRCRLQPWRGEGQAGSPQTSSCGGDSNNADEEGQAGSDEAGAEDDCGGGLRAGRRGLRAWRGGRVPSQTDGSRGSDGPLGAGQCAGSGRGPELGRGPQVPRLRPL